MDSVTLATGATSARTEKRRRKDTVETAAEQLERLRDRLAKRISDLEGVYVCGGDTAIPVDSLTDADGFLPWLVTASTDRFRLEGNGGPAGFLLRRSPEAVFGVEVTGYDGKAGQIGSVVNRIIRVLKRSADPARAFVFDLARIDTSRLQDLVIGSAS